MAITTELVGTLGGYSLSVQPELGTVYDLGRQSGDCLLHKISGGNSSFQLRCSFDGKEPVDVGTSSASARYGVGPNGPDGESFRTIQFYGDIPWMVIITPRGDDDYPYWKDS